jgi:DNA polymerase-1
MNAGIQGLAADIFKVALVRLDARLEREALASRLVLQVHDEVILEVPPAEEHAATAIVLGAMQGAAELRVPLAVNLSWGATWADAKAAQPRPAGDGGEEEVLFVPADLEDPLRA